LLVDLHVTAVCVGAIVMRCVSYPFHGHVIMTCRGTSVQDVCFQVQDSIQVSGAGK